MVFRQVCHGAPELFREMRLEATSCFCVIQSFDAEEEGERKNQIGFGQIAATSHAPPAHYAVRHRLNVEPRVSEKHAEAHEHGGQVREALHFVVAADWMPATGCEQVVT